MSWIWTLLAAIVIASLIRVYIAEPIKVDGNSMTNTLMDGEIMLVSKLDYRFGEMERGDVVVCRYPGRIQGSVNLGAALSMETHTLFVKRLVGLPGDTLWIEDRQAVPQMVASPRIGVEYAKECGQHPWRFTIRDCPWVSVKPLRGEPL